MNTSIKKIHMTLPAVSELIDTVRYTLYGISCPLGFSVEDIDDMKLAVGEACNNAVVHAYPVKQGDLSITFTIFEDRLQISVKDQGESFHADGALQSASSLHNKSLDELTIGGLGLYLMEKLMDRVNIHTGRGTEVVLTKYYKSNHLNNQHLQEADEERGSMIW